jgi:ribonuclease BN (tRNA processing enzyme)
MAAGAMPANWYDADSKKIQREIASRSGTKIVLLGTGGGPVIGRSRRQTSVLMLHDEDAYMLDFGLGAVQQFARTGTSFSQVRSLFLTLQRPDHTTDYGPFLLQGWIHGLNSSVQAYGPPGLTTMTGGYIKAMKHTIEFWSESFDIPPLKPIATQEFTRGGFVMQDGTVRVTSALVKHPPVVPAFGYRFDFKDRSVAFSGDTAPTQSMINLAKGADVLIHEAMYVPAMGVSMRDDAKRQKVGFDAVVEHMIADHTAVEDVGKIAQAAGVKELVLYHLAPPGSHLTDEDWIAPAAKYFNGKIVVGRDLMMI